VAQPLSEGGQQQLIDFVQRPLLVVAVTVHEADHIAVDHQRRDPV
jgi:hypothetical protein